MKDTMLLFDLDGTLWDSAKEVAESWNIVMCRYDPDFSPLTPEDLGSLMGKTMDEIAESVLQEMDPEEGSALFKECEKFEIEYIAEHGGTLFPLVRETLAELQEEGYRMAIISNCQKGYIDAFFRSMNTKQYFCDMEEWGNTKLSKADNIRLVMERNHAEKAIYIGDTEKDQESAKAAGVPFIFASYGFGNAKDPDGTIDQFAQLPAYLDSWQPQEGRR